MLDASRPARTGAALSAGLLAWHWLPWYPSLLIAVLVTLALTALQGTCPSHQE